MSFIRETPVGDFLRRCGLRTHFKFPEEHDDFQVRTTQEPLTEKSPIGAPSDGLATPESEVPTTLESSSELDDLPKKEPVADAAFASSTDSVDADPHIVDWYHDADPANPRNWSGIKKFWVTFVIW